MGGDVNAARADLEQLWTRTGGYPGLAGPLGRIYIRANDTAALDKLIGKQLEDPRASDDVVLVGARLRLKQNDVAAAKVLVEKILAKNPNHWEAHLLRAQIHLAQSDPEGAMVEIQQARPKSPDAEVEMWFGKIQAANGRSAEALRSFQKASELDPTLLEARYLHGRLLAEQGAAKLALGELESVVKSSDAFPAAWVGIGLARRDLGQADAAVQAFHKAAELDPTLREASYWEGRTLAERNDHARAIVALERAVAGDPPDAPWLAFAYRMLGRSAATLGKSPAARRALEAYLRLAPAGDPGRAEAQRLLRDL
jgi:tetratricopeptide (TPR) repeat protein